MDRLVHYVIRPGEVEQVLVITNNITTFGYTYAKLKIKKIPENFCKISQTILVIEWIPSKLSWTPALQGSY